jgi:hypothetical protein
MPNAFLFKRIKLIKEKKESKLQKQLDKLLQISFIAVALENLGDGFRE